jgi:hypothetical protein
MDLFVMVIAVFSGAAIIGILFQALTGRRDSGNVLQPRGFWRPPEVPEDEWKKWGDL